MTKDNSKPAASHDLPAEPVAQKPLDNAQVGQFSIAERLELPEASEHAEVSGAQALAQEYHESAKLLGRSETTEKDLMLMAENAGKQPDEVISAYLHEQLPRQDFYEQPVLVSESS